MQETQEVRVRSLGREEPLEEEMATHSSILAWRISRTEELAGCSLWDCQESDVTEQQRACTHTHTHTHTPHLERGNDGRNSVFLCFYFSVLMTVAVMGCIESWLNPLNVHSSFLRVFILQDSLMGLAFMVTHVWAYHLSIFCLWGSLSASICILPPRETPSLKMQP